MSKSIPSLVAHRGYPHRYPENSIEGIRAALESGACFVEFDIQLSADHVPVVIHDEDLKRTSGLKQNVLTTPFADLKHLCIGEAERFGDLYKDVHLSSLDDIVELFTSWPNAQAVVEIKRQSLARFGVDVVFESVANAIEPIRNRSIVISFDYDIVAEFRRQDISQTGWILGGYNEEIMTRATALQPNYLIINQKRIPPSTALLWPGSWQWMIYLTNEPQSAMDLARLGASHVETNAIGEMLQHPLLKQKASGNE